MSPQEETVATYQNNFDMYKEKTPSEISGEFIDLMEKFIKYIPSNGTIFEIGSASGRDARYLKNKGFTVLCTDVIPQALEELNDEGFSTSYYDFRSKPKEEWLRAYDAILAKAVFLHATQADFEEALHHLLSILTKDGVLCLSFKLGEDEELETGKLGGLRYFKYYSQEELTDIFTKYPLMVLDTAETSDSKWIQFILKKVT